MRFLRYLAAAWQHAITLLARWWNQPDDLADDGRWVHELIESPQRAVNAQLRQLLAELGGVPMATSHPEETVLADLELWIMVACEQVERATASADREGLDVPAGIRVMPGQLKAWAWRLEVPEGRAG